MEDQDLFFLMLSWRLLCFCSMSYTFSACFPADYCRRDVLFPVLLACIPGIPSDMGNYADTVNLAGFLMQYEMVEEAVLAMLLSRWLR